MAENQTDLPPQSIPWLVEKYAKVYNEHFPAPYRASVKFLLLAFFIALIWLLLRPRMRQPKPKPEARPDEKMVVCAHCGVFLPVSDALPDGDAHYCSEAHRRAGRGGA